MDHSVESESVSEAGDVGDRSLQSNRFSTDSGWIRFSIDQAMENAILVPFTNTQMISSEEKKQEDKKEMPMVLAYISCLVHLAVFGILGVLTRYFLQKLFGPGVIGLTNDQSILYLDLPSNMVGSFLMGWLGVVFKKEISNFSDNLAIGLSTGYLGSLTTFSGWNQKMLNLSANGHWVFAFLGFLLGLFLAAYSLQFGIETAKGFRWVLERKNGVSFWSGRNWRVDGSKIQLGVIVFFLLLLGLLCTVSGVLLKKEFHSASGEAQLWLGCLVGPIGVWARWFLARLNGRGLGRSGLLEWVPFGTLIANVSAACIMAALSTLKKAMKTKTCDTVASGIQFGLLGCLSTVSTLMAEFNAMRESEQPWRAYAYAALTILASFALGTLIYSVPVWAKPYQYSSQLFKDVYT